MGRINLNNLSDELKDYLNNLGLNQEDVELILNECLKVVNEKNIYQDNERQEINEIIGTMNSLSTNEKNDIVRAVNELIITYNNNKNDIMNTLGVDNDEIIDDKIEEIKDNINSLSTQMNNCRIEEQTDRDRLYTLMYDTGNYTLNGTENIDTLLDMLELTGISLQELLQISCGYSNTFIIKNDGSLWACGSNSAYHLGYDSYGGYATSFRQINTNVKQVSIGGIYDYSTYGYFFTFVVKNDGSLWACGYNQYGQLGLGDPINGDGYQRTFKQVTTNINNDVKQVACGGMHTLILKNDGSVWGTCSNADGQLGLGNGGNTYNTFTKVTTNINNDVKEIYTRGYHSFILKNDGTLWGCGYNYYGQLGAGANGTSTTVFTKSNIDNVKRVACGFNHTFVIKNDGTLWGCGQNESGQLGLGNTATKPTFTKLNIDNVKYVECYDTHTLILKNDGSLWTCGYNEYGQLGTGAGTAFVSNYTPVKILDDVYQIAGGHFHSAVLKNDGTVWTCGFNHFGQLGIGRSDSNAHESFTKVNINI